MTSPAKVGMVPTSRNVTKFSSPPAGTPSITRFGRAPNALEAASSASATRADASFTWVESSFTVARRASFSAPDAFATSLPMTFCSARNVSKAAIASRLAASACRAVSTSDSSAPLERSDALMTSGESRRSWGSITPLVCHAHSLEPVRKPSSHALASTNAASLFRGDTSGLWPLARG